MGIVIKIIRWVMGSFFILGGLGGFISDEVGIGIILTIIGLVILPLALFKRKLSSDAKKTFHEDIEPSLESNDSPKSSVSKNSNTRSLTIDVGAIIENSIEKNRKREEQIKNYDYHYPTIRGWSLQLLESVHLLGTTKNFDTLKGRYEFISQFYDDMCLAKHNKRYTSDIQQGIDSFKSTYYGTILQDYEIDLLYNPNQEKLKEYYINTIGHCFGLFLDEQSVALGSLKRVSAKQNRIVKIDDVADQAIREIVSINLSGDLGNKISKQIRKKRDELAVQYETTPKSTLSEAMDQLMVNPKSSFPMTIYNAPTAKLRKVAKVLKSENYNKIAELLPLFAEHNIKCQEIEEYINKYKPLYLQRIQDEKDKSTEYQQATVMDRLDMEQEYKDRAVTLLYELANCDLQELFDYNEIPLTVDDQLIQDYGFENLSLYMKLHQRVGKVITNWERKEIEHLGKTDLVSMIDEIDIDEVLLTLPLKILNAIAEHGEGHFKRKKTAVAYINENNLSGNLGKHIATRKIFKVNPLPLHYKDVDINQVANSWAYLKEYLRLFVDTYRDGEYNADQTSRNYDYVDGWKVDQGYKDGCHRANEECNKLYTKSNPPKLPFHVGCTCRLRTEMKDYS